MRTFRILKIAITSSYPLHLSNFLLFYFYSLCQLVPRKYPFIYLIYSAEKSEIQFSENMSQQDPYPAKGYEHCNLRTLTCISMQNGLTCETEQGVLVKDNRSRESWIFKSFRKCSLGDLCINVRFFKAKTGFQRDLSSQTGKTPMK